MLITMEEPTQPMRTEAARRASTSRLGQAPELQILTVAELLEGKRIDAPPLGQVGRTFKKAPREAEEHEHLTLTLDDG